jgi:glucokinase
MPILAGDIGGTKARLALYEDAETAQADLPELRKVQDFDSREASSLEEIVVQFLGEFGAAGSIDAACFGIPGPVVGGNVRATNLPWLLDERTLSANLKIPRLKLVNDLAATAAAVPFLGAGQLRVLHPGSDDRERRLYAVLAPGTGLGQAFLYRDDDGRYHPFPSEGGHAGFAPSNPLEIALLEYLRLKFPDHVSVERVLSGPGLFNVYCFLRDTHRCAEPAALREEVRTAEHPSAVIGEHGAAGTCEICVRALDIFAGALGSYAGDLVLAYLSTGGLFLGGGIPPKIADKLTEGSTVAAYLEKGRLSPLVRSAPLRIIMDDRAALHGAAFIARGRLRSPQ